MSVSVVTTPVTPTPKANCVCWVFNLSTVGTPGSTKVEALIQVCDDAGNPIVLGGTDGIQVVSPEAPGNFEICITDLVQHLIYAQSHNPAQVGTATLGPSFPEPFISKKFKIRYGYLTSSQDPNNCTVPVQTWQGFTNSVVVTNAAAQTYEWWAQLENNTRPMAHLPTTIYACTDVPLILTVWKSQGISAPLIGWTSASQGGNATTHVITPQEPGLVTYEIQGTIDPVTQSLPPVQPYRFNVVWKDCCCKSTFNNVRFISQRGGWMSISFDCDAELGATTEGQTICTVGKCLQLENGANDEPYNIWNTSGGDRQYNKKGRETVTLTKKFVDQVYAVANGKQEEYVKDFLFSPVHHIIWQSPYDPLVANPNNISPQLSARQFNLVYGSYVYSKRTSEFILTVQFEATHQRVIQKSSVR